MGEKHRKIQGEQQMLRRDANTYLASRGQQLAEQRRAQSERQLGIEESLLGTDAQASGQLGGVSPELLPFLGRYQFDSTATLKTSHTNKRLTTEFLQGKTDAANALMQQAEDAARSGDFATAEQLRAQASAGLTAGKEFGQLQGTAGLDQIFQLVEDPATAARARMGTVQSQLVGRQLQEARQFQDFNSEASINERRLMSEAGERSIAAQQRTAARQGRNTALGSGAAQTAYGRNVGQERSAREFGQDRAQLFASVADNFQKMQRAYGKDTVGFARDYLQGGSGIRESFQSALDQLKTNFSQLAQQTAQMNQQMAQFQFQRGDFEKARSDARTHYYQDLIVGVSGAVLGGLMQGIPGMGGIGQNIAAVTGGRRGMPQQGQGQGGQQQGGLGGGDALMAVLGAM